MPNTTRRIDFLACCRVSRAPVYTSPDWCWHSPQDGFRVRIERIGARIIRLTSAGHVNRHHLQIGWHIFRRVMVDAPAMAPPLVVVADHSQITGMTLNARRYLVRELQPLTEVGLYVACGVPTHVGRRLYSSPRRKRYNFQILVASDYVAAVQTAVAWLARSSGLAHGVSGIQASPGPHPNASPHASSPELQAASLEDYARELYEYIGRLNLERDVVDDAQHKVPAGHPFRAVYDALGMIHSDMIRILARHQRNLLRLREQEQALVAKNAALAETQTTLKILLHRRREERRDQTTRIGQRFRDLLLPIAAGLDETPLTPGQRRQYGFICDVISHISRTFSFNDRRGRLKLTPRETLTAYLVARGCTTREAAAVLNTSPRTIECYRANLRRKAGLSGRRGSLAAWLNSPPDGGDASASWPI
jgi:DNA-binding CsgD family transcriptional regulator